MGWSNDPTIDPTSENNGNVKRPHPTFLISVKFHPTSKVMMLGDPTRWSNDPLMATHMVLGEMLGEMLDRLTGAL